MVTRLNPYLGFEDTARAAMEFYRSVFGGDLAVSTFGEFGAGGPAADRVMHAQLETPSGFTLMAADTPEGAPPFERGTNMTVSLTGDERDVLVGYFERLAEGGTVTTPLEKQVWGDEFGMLTDRFGIGWLVNIAGSAS
ncbi:VOC family protein [Terrabacter sp. NPDC000476]|uniref:VOC family protein n=1 Tax=Terrabacter sp. NPDC000476 TaxID=3154258 RepID=UPI00331ED6C3